jgi:hypothetical protein
MIILSWTPLADIRPSCPPISAANGLPLKPDQLALPFAAQNLPSKLKSYVSPSQACLSVQTGNWCIFISMEIGWYRYVTDTFALPDVKKCTQKKIGRPRTE